MQPTVGRIVHFYILGDVPLPEPGGKPPFAALVVAVHSDHLILRVFAETTTQSCITSLVPNDREPVPDALHAAQSICVKQVLIRGWWQWPPKAV